MSPAFAKGGDKKVCFLSHAERKVGRSEFFFFIFHTELMLDGI